MSAPHPAPSSFLRLPMRAGLVVLAAFLVGAGAAGCNRPVRVAFDPTGARKIEARGDVGVAGKLGRALVYQGKEFPEGTPVVVSETFLIRRDKGDPPAYRVGGLYDPARRSEGFVLPAGAIDVFFYSYLVDKPRTFVPVPQEHFVLQEQGPGSAGAR